MIIVNLKGGLGNQMFQYAIGRKLAIKRKTKLYLDLSFYDDIKPEQYTFREFALNKFNIKYSLAKLKHIQKFNRSLNILDKFLNRCYLTLNNNIDSVELNRINSKVSLLLNGYWQSENNFIDVRNILLKDFQLLNKISEKSIKISEQINSTSSVSVHFRRGDYITNAKTNKTHGVCSIDYYKSAIDIMKSKISNPFFYIFSDDISWVKNNFNISENFFYISSVVDNDFEELVLMKNCKHHIIANSSFSWWAAWLSENPDKIVIAPQKWFNTKRDTSNLIPSSWIRI